MDELSYYNQSYSAADLNLLKTWTYFFTLPTWLSKTIVVVSFTIGVLVNTLILFYFFKSGKYRLPVFTLFTSLAITDWFTCVTNAVITQIAFPEVISLVGTREICLIMNYILVATYSASVLQLVFLAALRYYQLCYPLQARVRVVASWVRNRCVVTYILAIIASIPMPFFRDVHEIRYHDRTVKLFVFTGNFEVKEIMTTSLLALPSLAAIVVLHLLKLYKMSKNPDLSKQNTRSASSRTAALIIIVYAISLMPRFMHSFYHVVLGYPYQSFHKFLAISGGRSTFSNSIINPFLYLFGSAEIRNDIAKMIFCRK